MLLLIVFGSWAAIAGRLSGGFEAVAGTYLFRVVMFQMARRTLSFPSGKETSPSSPERWVLGPRQAGPDLRHGVSPWRTAKRIAADRVPDGACHPPDEGTISQPATGQVVPLWTRLQVRGGRSARPSHRAHLAPRWSGRRCRLGPEHSYPPDQRGKADRQRGEVEQGRDHVAGEHDLADQQQAAPEREPPGPPGHHGS